MGCNTSKEAMQAAAENASAAAEPKLQSFVQQQESVLNNVVEKGKEAVTEVVAASKEAAEEAAMDVAEKGRKVVADVVSSGKEALSDVVEKGKEAVKGVVRRGDVSDIDVNDPEANRAATKIQAAFRGHQTRKNMKQGDAEPKANLKEEFSPENKELCEAATKIQASFRGHLVRKSAPRKDEEDEELSKELEKLDAKEPEEELDIDLSDPDLQVAATKIQASFRGHRVRKEKQVPNQ